MPENFGYGNKYKPLQVYELRDSIVQEQTDGAYKNLMDQIECNMRVLAVKAGEYFDKKVHEAMTREALKDGIAALVIFDRDFIVDAIRMKLVAMEAEEAKYMREEREAIQKECE